jgi:hypothetical protein
MHGQGQTSNLHVAAFIMSLLHKKRVLMMQTHFSQNNLESPLVGQNAGKPAKDENDLFSEIGLDAAVTYNNMNKLSLSMLENCCLSFQNASLLLLPGTEIKNRETFDRDIGKSVKRMVQKADEYIDLILIDANSGNDRLSFHLLDNADLVIVNLSQHRYVLDKFFAEYSSYFQNKKVFYLFGDYDDNSTYNIHNVLRTYKKYLSDRNTGVIPYCTKFMDAQNECKIIQFLQEGLGLYEDGDFDKLLKGLRKRVRGGRYPFEEEEYFFHCSRHAVEKIFKLLRIPNRREHQEDVSA